MAQEAEEDLGGFVRERLAAAVQEIVAAVERAVAGYEAQAAGYRAQISRQKEQLQNRGTTTTSDTSEPSVVSEEDGTFSVLQDNQEKSSTNSSSATTTVTVTTHCAIKDKAQNENPAKKEDTRKEVKGLSSFSASSQNGRQDLKPEYNEETRKTREDTDEESNNFEEKLEWQADLTDHVDKCNETFTYDDNPKTQDDNLELKSQKIDSLLAKNMTLQEEENFDQPEVETHAKIRRKNAVKNTFVCGVCGKTLCDFRSLSRHHMTHSSERPHRCKACGRTFKLGTTLKQHEKIHAFRERSYLCDVCCKMYLTAEQLRVHMRSHTNEKPYKCDECGKGFVTKGTLAVHKNTHGGEAKYRCSECACSFKRKSHLEQHARLHSGLKPFVCGMCGRACARKSYLTAHMRTHSGERPYKCCRCHKAFTQSHCLKTHMRRHREHEAAPNAT